MLGLLERTTKLTSPRGENAFSRQRPEGSFLNCRSLSLRALQYFAVRRGVQIAGSVNFGARLSSGRAVAHAAVLSALG
jgi:hypothetical protein